MISNTREDQEETQDSTEAIVKLLIFHVTYTSLTKQKYASENAEQV